MLKLFHNIFGRRKDQKQNLTSNTTVVDGNSHNLPDESISSTKCSSVNINQIDTIDVYTLEEFRKAVSDGNKAQCNIVIRESCIKDFSPITIVEGTLGLSDCNIESLSPIKVVRGEIWCSYHHKKPILKTLGTLQRVDGHANFRHMPLENLGDLEYVGGNLSLRDTNICNLGKLKYVGGSLFLPMRLKGVVDLSNVSVGGQIRYWNDVDKSDSKDRNDKSEFILTKSTTQVPYWKHTYIYPNHCMSLEPVEIRNFYNHFKECFEKGILLDTEGYSNYYFVLAFDLRWMYQDPCKLAEKYSLLTAGYPKLKPYCDNILIELYRENQMFVQEWDIVKERPYMSLKIVNDYIDKLGNDIFDGDIAAKICGISCLTSFGKTHKKEVLSFFRQCLQAFEKRHGCRFYDLFYDQGKDYKLVNGKYKPEYYRQFYKLNEHLFDYYNELSDYKDQEPVGRIYIVEQAICEQLRLLLIEAEDAYRESIDVPKIGEGWINETALFYKIKEHYKDYKIIHHGHPKWLGKQHLDIYFINENIGIEYQGVQHYKAVDYFGGEEGFAKNQERDERKRKLCAENSCILICIDEGYDFKDVVAQIDNAINIQKGRLGSHM